MQRTRRYGSPLGGILLAGDEIGLTGLWFDGQKHFAHGLDPDHREGDLPALEQAAMWLDAYFAGRAPDFTPPLRTIGTEFQREVWRLLLQIPYGETTTYGELARKVAARRGLKSMSAQAVGGAVRHNEISIIIPCHRVIGTNGSLTGYAGGIDKKMKLLELEGVDMSRYFIPIPKGRTALTGKEGQAP